MEEDWRVKYFCAKDRNLQLLEKGYFSDCSFLVGDGLNEERKIFAAHKAFLATASAVFETMFFGSLTEKTDEPIKIEDIEPSSFSIMLKYIYTDSVYLENWEKAAKLFDVAKKYMIHQLKKYCIEYITNELNASNVLAIYEVAKFHEELNLIESSLKIIRDETINVLNSDYFLEINISTMITILEQDKLQTTEMELFNALECLAKSKGAISKTVQEVNGNQNINTAVSDEDKESNINIPITKKEEPTTEISVEKKAVLVGKFRKALKMINFHLLTSEQFLNSCASSQMFLPVEVVAIAACLVRPSKLPNVYPKDFKQNIRSSKCLPHIYMDITVNGLAIGRIVIELRSDVFPNIAEMFLKFINENNARSPENIIFNIYSDGFQLKKRVNVTPVTQIYEFNNTLLKNNGFGTISILTESRSRGVNLISGFGIAFKIPTIYNDVIGLTIKGMDVIETMKSYAIKTGSPKANAVVYLKPNLLFALEFTIKLKTQFFL